MREIKFRAWNEVEGFLDRAWSIDFEHRLVCHRAHNQSDLDDCVLIQYTGLKDKNGREIFEGDLYTFDDYKVFISGGYIEEWSGETVDVVKFENGAFYYGDELLSDSIDKNVLVNYVGNIFENPELLEGK